jgi:hypothetical protein
METTGGVQNMGVLTVPVPENTKNRINKKTLKLWRFYINFLGQPLPKKYSHIHV